jgi:hypothetical protein
MKRNLIFFGILLLSVILYDCQKDTCNDFIGAYSGVIEGSFEGTITLVVTGSEDNAMVEGTWSAVDQNTGGSYNGKINSSSVDCSSGAIDYVYGFSLTGPYNILCPAAESWCYDSGATLGEFKGNLNIESGAGTWKADTGAAETVGATGSGTWYVTKM